MAKLNDARRSLLRAKESAKKRLQQLDEERREIKSSLKSLDLALKALGHKPATSAKIAAPAVVIDKARDKGGPNVE